MEMRVSQNVRGDALHGKWAALIFAMALFCAPLCRAAAPATQPWPGVTYVHEQHSDPAESMFVVKIDLTNPNVTIRVAPAGPDPDGPGEWQTTLQPTGLVAQ